jgi:adenine-specific DNA-methyltransferase
MTCESKSIMQNFYSSTHHNSFLVKIDEDNVDLKNTLEKTKVRLGEITNINQAIALKHDRSKSLSKQKTANNFKPVLDGRNIKRYVIEWGKEYLAYDVKNIHSCKRTDIFEAKEKIFFRRVGDRLIATYDNAQFYALNTLVVITMKTLSETSLKYMLGLINSKLLNFYYETYLKSTKKVFSEIQARQIAQLPIRTLDFSDPEDVARHDRMVSLVDQMLSLQKQLPEARTPHEQTGLQRQIEATDGQIDTLVYELYGMTEEEIKIVEGKCR